MRVRSLLSSSDEKERLGLGSICIGGLGELVGEAISTASFGLKKYDPIL